MWFSMGFALVHTMYETSGCLCVQFDCFTSAMSESTLTKVFLNDCTSVGVDDDVKRDELTEFNVLSVVRLIFSSVLTASNWLCLSVDVETLTEKQFWLHLSLCSQQWSDWMLLFANIDVVFAAAVGFCLLPSINLGANKSTTQLRRSTIAQEHFMNFYFDFFCFVVFVFIFRFGFDFFSYCQCSLMLSKRILRDDRENLISKNVSILWFLNLVLFFVTLTIYFGKQRRSVSLRSRWFSSRTTLSTKPVFFTIFATDHTHFGPFIDSLAFKWNIFNENFDFRVRISNKIYPRKTTCLNSSSFCRSTNALETNFNMNSIE